MTEKFYCVNLMVNDLKNKESQPLKVEFLFSSVPSKIDVLNKFSEYNLDIPTLVKVTDLFNEFFEVLNDWPSVDYFEENENVSSFSHLRNSNIAEVSLTVDFYAPIPQEEFQIHKAHYGKSQLLVSNYKALISISKFVV